MLHLIIIIHILNSLFAKEINTDWENMIYLCFDLNGRKNCDVWRHSSSQKPNETTENQISKVKNVDSQSQNPSFPPLFQVHK